MLLASSCGGGHLSHGDFVKKADAICRAWLAAAGPAAHPRSYGEIEAYVKRTLPLYESALRKLEALDPPAKDAKAVRTWLAADRRVAKSLRALATAAQRRDFPSVTAATGRGELAGSEGRRVAVGLGLQVCGRLSAR